MNQYNESWSQESETMKKLVSSLKGQLIKIDYIIRIDIKHRTDAAMDAMTRVDFPVKILGKLGTQLHMQGDAMEG